MARVIGAVVVGVPRRSPIQLQSFGLRLLTPLFVPQGASGMVKFELGH